MKKLPIGTQSFEELRSNDYLYVDKTEDIYRLITNNRIVFLSRPRRFGKSLLVSTLGELYKGSKSLFEGLYIYDKWDWTQRYPVIRIDWTRIKRGNKDEMEMDMSDFLQLIASANEIILNSRFASSRFAELIEALHSKTGKKAVVLVDEYDRPILNSMGKPEAEGIREFLQEFYMILKAIDDHLKFIFLTGVTKVAKVSIFSVLNSPSDITLNEKYASICGYTQEELERDFSDYIGETSENKNMTKEELVNNIRTWYDGYTWDGKTSVYNPFSTLNFFENSEFNNYWFESGTPTFLINRLKKRNLSETILEPVVTTASAFDSYDPNALDDIPLLFQTGYLTIKGKQSVGIRSEYTLEVPNLEVKESLMEHLLNAFTQYPIEQVRILADDMLRNIQACNSEGLQNNFRKLFAGVPYTIQQKGTATEDANEAHYHTVFQLLMTMMGFDIQSEKLTDKGRMDAVLQLPDAVVIAELKYHASTKLETLLNQAVNQIYEKRYYEQFLDRKVILLGLAFSGKEVGCKIEQLNV